MASKRQKKKQQKKQQIQIVSTAKKITQKQAEKLSKNEREYIVAQWQKKEKRNAARRAKYAANKKLIDEYGLKGVKPTDTQAKIQKAIVASEKTKAAEEKKRREKERRERIRTRNEELLLSGKIPPDEYPPRWYEMGEERLKSWIDTYHSDPVYNTGDVWLYIGFGTPTGETYVKEMIMSDGFYKQRTIETQRQDISKTLASKGEGQGSSGRPGIAIANYGSKEAMMEFINFQEFHHYQTIFFGNKFTEHGLISIINACLDYCNETDRVIFIEKINGFLNRVGLNKLKIYK